MSSTQVPPSVYARLNLAGEDDDSPEAEVERLLAEARAGRQEAEVEVDEEDLAMDEEEFEELLQELEAVWKSNFRRPTHRRDVVPLAPSPLSPYLRQHEPNSLVDFHTGRYHGLVGAGARRRAHPEAAPRPRRSGAYEVGGPPTRSGPAGTCRAARRQRRRLARAKEEKQGSDD